MRVRICTWNAGQVLYDDNIIKGKGGSALSVDFASWLEMEEEEDPSADHDEQPPCIYAFGFQETGPLPLTLSGKVDPTSVKSVQARLLEAIRAQNSKTYKNGSTHRFKLLSQASLAGISLYIFSSSDFATRVTSIQKSVVGCGPLFMGNKGAVGIRVVAEGSSQRQQRESWTFVCAHLAAHEHNVERRNLDWQNIVSRMIFVDDGDETDAQGGRSASRQIYDSSHLFVLGDLNYRLNLSSERSDTSNSEATAAPTSSSTPTSAPDNHEMKVITLAELAKRIEAGNHRELTESLDQLKDQQGRGRTLHGLNEHEISFPPTYKYKVGTDDYTSFKKRVPAWCDRVLYASTSSSLQVTQYQSVQSTRASDHKPVTALFSLPSTSAPSPPDASSSPSLALISQGTVVQLPFTADESRRVKRVIGTSMDTCIGSVWYSLYVLGFGDERAGVALVLVAGLSLVFAKYHYWQ